MRGYNPVTEDEEPVAFTGTAKRPTATRMVTGMADKPCSRSLLWNHGPTLLGRNK